MISTIERKPRSGSLVVLAAFFGVMAGFGSPVIFTSAHAPVMAIASAALIGFGLSGEAVSTPYGFAWNAYAIAGAIGPVVMGRACDLTGSYTLFLSVLASAGWVSAFLMLTMPRYDQAVSQVMTCRLGSHLRKGDVNWKPSNPERAYIRC